MATVATQIIAALARSGVRRVYGLPGDSLNGFTDAIRRSGRRHLGARPPRGDGGVRRGRRRRADRPAGGLRGQLRTGQPAPDQRTLRRPAQPGAGAGDRRAHPAQRDRLGVLPGDPPAGPVPRVQRLLRTGQHAGDGAAHPRDGDARRGRGERRRRRRRSPARSSWRTPTSPRWLHRPIVPTRSVVRPDDESLRRAAEILNAAERVTILGGAGVAGRARRTGRGWRARSTRRSCTRCAARSSSSTTTRTTSA